MKHIHQLWIEEGSHEGELFGFIEGRTQHHKSATSLAKKRRFMPLVCPLLGITGNNWVDAWMHSWRMLCVDIDKQPFGPLCRAASSTGGLRNTACTSDEINVFINAVLKATDPASSHSLKHTTLEWCSAYGIDEDARKLLGHHSLSGDKALAVYSKDLLRRPLQLYCSMLHNIRLDHFRPDESRTSRLIDALKMQAGVAVAPTQKVTQQGAGQSRCLLRQKRRMKVKMEKSLTMTIHLHRVHRVHRVQATRLAMTANMMLERHDWITGPVWRNLRSKVVHKVSFCSTMTFCGRAVGVSRFEFLQDGCSALFARCSLCFKGEVISSADGLADALQSVRSKRHLCRNL